MKLSYASYLAIIGPCINGSLLLSACYLFFKGLMPDRPLYPHHLLIFQTFSVPNPSFMVFIIYIR
jgi:hypothetical protein